MKTKKQKTCRKCQKLFVPREHQINFCTICAPTDVDRGLLKLYGVNLSWCEKTLRKQNYACALCLRLFADIAYNKRKNRAWVVDHDHTTNVARGLLCLSCNQLLGYWEMRGGQEWSDRAISYVRKTQ